MRFSLTSAASRRVFFLQKGGIHFSLTFELAFFPFSSSWRLELQPGVRSGKNEVWAPWGESVEWRLNWNIRPSLSLPQFFPLKHSSRGAIQWRSFPFLSFFAFLCVLKRSSSDWSAVRRRLSPLVVVHTSSLTLLMGTPKNTNYIHNDNKKGKGRFFRGLLRSTGRKSFLPTQRDTVPPCRCSRCRKFTASIPATSAVLYHSKVPFLFLFVDEISLFNLERDVFSSFSSPFRSNTLRICRSSSSFTGWDECVEKCRRKALLLKMPLFRKNEYLILRFLWLMMFRMVNKRISRLFL